MFSPFCSAGWGHLCDVAIRSTPLEMTSAAEAATKREGFGCRALSAVSFQRTACRCYFCKESIRCQSAAQVDNTEHCYHTRLGKVKSPISQLYNFACPPPRREKCRHNSEYGFQKG